MIKKHIMILVALFLISFVLVTESCNRKNAQSNEVELDPACMLEPETGPCKAAFERYYYDQEEKTCKMFLWGGCNGVVPFETLEDCQKKCNCK